MQLVKESCCGHRGPENSWKELGSSQHSSNVGFPRGLCRWVPISSAPRVVASTIIFVSAYPGGANNAVVTHDSFVSPLQRSSASCHLLESPFVPQAPQGKTAHSHVPVKPNAHFSANYSLNYKVFFCVGKWTGSSTNSYVEWTCLILGKTKAIYLFRKLLSHSIWADRKLVAMGISKKKSAQTQHPLQGLNDEVRTVQGAACLAQGGTAPVFCHPQLPHFCLKIKNNSEADQTAVSFCTWLKYNCYPELARLEESCCFIHWNSCRNYSFLKYEQYNTS